jgi:hemoglobin-like flavoprotein
MVLFQELFSIAPELQDSLFKEKPIELLSTKVGAITGELIRLLELPSPAALANNIAELSLKHVEYGLEPEHSQPFRDAMVNAIRKTVKAKGHKWHSKTQKAWNWALKEIISILVEATCSARPKVTLLKE